jgi:hypothetical protein
VAEKRKKGKDKQSGGQVDHHVGCHGQPLARLKSDHQHQGIFKHVIVKGPEKLGPEKGCEPSRGKQPAAIPRWGSDSGLSI